MGKTEGGEADSYYTQSWKVIVVNATQIIVSLKSDKSSEV